jgi:pilus assembly protein CpaB
LKLLNFLKVFKHKNWRLFFVALMFGLMAGLGTIVYLKVMEKDMENRLRPPRQEYKSVVVAGQNLKIGDKVSGQNVAVRQIPSAYVPADAITPDSFESVSGASIVKGLPRGRMLTEDMIDLDIPKDFSATLEEGLRAITISVDDLNSIAELIRPGNYIDIYTRMPASTQNLDTGQSQGDIIIPVLDNVLVLATGKKSSRANEDEFMNYSEVKKASKTYSTITLELSPSKAALLAVAREEGDLILVLRNKQDDGGTLFSTMDRSDLFANSKHMQQEALKKTINRSLEQVNKTVTGKLVTQDGIVITDPNVTMNKAGLLVTKDGIILSGRGLTVNADGKIVDEHGEAVETSTLVAGKDGVLIDSNGNVISSNGFETLEGGFVKDKDGNILTADGHKLIGVIVDEDGNVVTPDGKILNAKNLEFHKDGNVSLIQPKPLHINEKGQVIDQNGTVVKPDDFLSTDPDGRVFGSDGNVISGIYKGVDDKYHDDKGRELTQKDLVERYNKTMDLDPQQHVNEKGEVVDQKLAGVSVEPVKDFTKKFIIKKPEILNHARLIRQVEFIIGGGSNGAAIKFNVPVEDLNKADQNLIKEK